MGVAAKAFAQRLKPRAQGRLRVNTTMPLTRADCLRSQPKRSIPKDMRFSNTAITVEKLAKVMKRKKS